MALEKPKEQKVTPPKTIEGEEQGIQTPEGDPAVPSGETPAVSTLQTEAVENVPTGADPSSGLYRTLWVRNFWLESASAFADKLFQMAIEDRETPILVMITSFGGSVHACLAMADAMDPHEEIDFMKPKLKEAAGTDDPSKVDFTGFPTLLERTKEAFPDAILPSEKSKK